MKKILYSQTSFLKTLQLLLVFLFAGKMYSQNTGILTGQIIDAKTQIPLSGATVLLENTNLGVISDSKGFFKIESIPTQTYNVSVQYLGYQTLTEYNVIVKSVGNTPLLFRLEESPSTLSEVTVTQARFRTSRETPLSTQTFSAIEIETYPGGNNDIAKVVQSMPGISPSIGGFRNDIIIRGGAPNETVYYLDGIEIPNINHFSTQGSAGGPVGMINVSFIREVTLSSSAFGAEYDNPLSGVLAFEQRTGNPDRFAGNFRLGASEAALTLEGPLIRNKKSDVAPTTLLFSVRRSYLQFLFELIDLPIRPDYWDFQWKVQHTIDDFNTLHLVGLGSIDDFSVKPSKTFDALQQATIEQVPIIEQRTNTIGLSWNRKFKNNKGQMTLAISNNRLENNFSQYEDNVVKEGVVIQNDSYEDETKLRFQSTHYGIHWKWSAGGNIQYSDYKNATQFVSQNINYETQIDFLKYGVFAKATRSYFESKLDVSFGIRADADSFSTGSTLLDNLSPRFSLSYALTDDREWKINASLGRYFKIPTYTMLGFQNTQGEFINQNAQYTQSNHYVVGIEYNLNPASRITVEGFLKKYNQYPISVVDQVSLANKGADFEVFGNEAITTNGKGETYGVEFLFQQKLQNNFYGIFAYTFFYSRFTDANGVFRPSVWDSRHLLSFTGGYKLKRNWELSARWRFSGKTPYVPTDLDASLPVYPEIILDYNQLGNVLLDPFSQADIRIDKKWNFKKLSFNFYFEVQNFLAQAIPIPEEYGLNRNENGMLMDPLSLVPINVNERNNIPIPTFGFVLYF